MRYFLQLAYDGTNYAGWQIQPNVATIQGVLEKAISTLTRHETSLMGCGRTDRGVHATKYFAHFDVSEVLDRSKFVFQLNGILPRDISCSQLIEVDDHCHARFDAKERAYTYFVHTAKDPFRSRFSTFFPQGRSIDESKLHQCASFIAEQRDFKSFCKAHTDNKTNYCSIYKSDWLFNPETEIMEYHICANRFLRGMVRLIVGSSLNVAIGKLSFEEFQQHVLDGTRNDKMSSAPATGLALTNVTYPFL